MKQATEMPTKTALLINATRGPLNKGAVLVCGALSFEQEHELIHERCKNVVVFETSKARKRSVIDGYETFRIPRELRGKRLQLDDTSWFEPRPPSIAVLLRGCGEANVVSQMQAGSVIIGQADLVRQACKGRRFYPRARWRNLVQVELA